MVTAPLLADHTPVDPAGAVLLVKFTVPLHTVALEALTVGVTTLLLVMIMLLVAVQLPLALSTTVHVNVAVAPAAKVVTVTSTLLPI